MVTDAMSKKEIEAFVASQTTLATSDTSVLEAPKRKTKKTKNAQ